MIQRHFLPAVLCLLVSSAATHAADVTVRQEGDVVRVEVNGRHLTDYHYKEVSRPFLYPVIGPGGARMSRNWPMAEGANEEKDHPHHRSLWYAHGNINGVDFWSESARAGKTRHLEFTKLQSGPEKGILQSRNELVSREGKVIATDERTMTFYPPSDDGSQIIDFDVTVRASHGELVFGDTKEGSMAIRLAPTLRLRGKVGQGHIVNSEGVKDGATWGKRAKWCDYYGPVDGKTVGVAIFDHPQNPRHPTWWHVRDYGLFAANPFGIHDFERKPAGTGDLKVPAGDSVTFRYRFLFHPGNTEEGKVAQQYDDYAGSARP